MPASHSQPQGGVEELQRAGFVPFDRDISAFIDSLTGLFKLDHRVYGGARVCDDIMADPPDVLFFGPDRASLLSEGAYTFCRRLRGEGYMGIVLLVIDEEEQPYSTSDITSLGFDNYILSGGSPALWRDSIHWGILNRRRKNKYIVQFDGNPDCFCILDRQGCLHEINQTAAAGSGHTPREIVNGRIPAGTIPSLKKCVPHVVPLIEEEHVNGVFNFTVEEGRSVFQLKAKIHRIPTLGLVATMLKSDITDTIYGRTLDILINSVLMLSERDQYTAGHSARVLHYCMHLAETLGHGGNRRFKTQLYHAALLHDIGKVGIRDSILLKPGKLTEEEFNSLSTHSVKGYKILSHFEFLKDCLDLIRHHHERPDGRGYPDKLRGGKIPLGASIISVADGFDAMTTNRPYRSSLGFERAVREIEENRGSQYSPEVADAFLSFITPALHRETREMSRRPLNTIAQGIFGKI